ncbi:ABC transporter permease [Spongisporangium articulatum]|uniref:ABC transporter permease n=1 Tax=Spongisporangium articulatum TaxID=3362603 RepID=A0ABW8AHR2_9ACTN
MTATVEAPTEPAEPAAAPEPERPGVDWKAIGEVAVRWVAAVLGAIIIFGAILLTKGANPFEVFSTAWEQTVMNSYSVQQILIKAAPFALAALAVVVPSRAGLVNVGGEGQTIIGGVAAAGLYIWLGATLPGGLMLLVMLLGGVVAGALWAGIAAAMRLTVSVNEAVTTLLLNYVALDLLLALIYQPWKDPNGSGQPATAQIGDAVKLPVFTGTKVHYGLLIAVLAAVAVWALFKYTAWGYNLQAVGGNPEAARRAGLPVTTLLLTAMLVGGALAGLGGAIHLTGVEYQLRPSFGAQIGYLGFLASWLAMHKPGAVLAAATVLAGLAVAGDSLQLDSGLPAATSNILAGLILIAVLGWTGTKKKASTR